jgi:hypothetical protein
MGRTRLPLRALEAEKPEKPPWRRAWRARRATTDPAPVRPRRAGEGARIRLNIRKVSWSIVLTSTQNTRALHDSLATRSRVPILDEKIFALDYSIRRQRPVDIGTLRAYAPRASRILGSRMNVSQEDAVRFRKSSATLKWPSAIWRVRGSWERSRVRRGR